MNELKKVESLNRHSRQGEFTLVSLSFKIWILNLRSWDEVGISRINLFS